MNEGLGIYIHIPFCRQKCFYCDFPSYGNLGEYYDRYVHALCKEMEIWAKIEKRMSAQPVESVYFGGGTPTELSLLQLKKILEQVRLYFAVAEETEYTIECNPEKVSKEYLEGLVNLGFTRISFGVQSFNNELLRSIGRLHTEDEAKTAIFQAKEAGFDNISLDIMYGLPKQTMKDIRQDIELIKKLPIKHISVYGLQLEANTYLDKLVRSGHIVLPSEEDVESMYDYITTTLPLVGFERYEISNFAKEQYYSRHNMRYWQYKAYAGFGSGSHAFYDNMRRAKPDFVVPYCQSIEEGQIPYILEEHISAERAREDYCFLHLRTKGGICIDEFKIRFGIDLETLYEEEIAYLLSKKLIIKKNNAYVLTSRGAKLGNQVFELFIK